MHRIYYPLDFSEERWITITDSSENHHICHVLRLGRGDHVEVFNGQGLCAQGEILEAGLRTTRVCLLSIRKKFSTSKTPALLLACAIPKKGKFETIIEKATELGVSEIIPLMTQRTEWRLTRQQAEKKMKRYRTVALNAARQSRRSIVPEIHPVTPFLKVMGYLKRSTMIIPSLCGERKTLMAVLQSSQSAQKLSFLIGPEGDFTNQEYQLAWHQGAIAVTLGETVLKVETAAIAVCACARLFYHSS